jgi:hypothetical protein
MFFRPASPVGERPDGPRVKRWECWKTPAEIPDFHGKGRRRWKLGEEMKVVGKENDGFIRGLGCFVLEWLSTDAQVVMFRGTLPRDRAAKVRGLAKFSCGPLELQYQESFGFDTSVEAVKKGWPRPRRDITCGRRDNIQRSWGDAGRL